MRAILVGGAAVALTAGVLGIPAASAAETPAAPASVAYLQQRYGISQAEAVRRLDLQLSSVDLAARLAKQFPDEYAGMWLDQAHGGVLKIGMTKPARPTGLKDPAHVQTVRVTRSLKELTATAAQLSGTAGTQAVVDAPSNSVVVTSTGSAPALSPGLRSALRVAAGVQVQTRDTNGTVQKSCDPRYCARAPMTGGIRIDVTRDDGTYGGCTTGFNLKGKTTGAMYLLTAGHCVNSPRHQNLDKTWHQLYGPKWPVTEERTTQLAVNEYPNDWAVMPYQAGAEDLWFHPGRPINPPNYLVNYWCPGGCGSRNIPVTGYVDYDAIQVGWVVCATGAGYTPSGNESYVDSGAGVGYVPGTRCGEIFSKATGGIDVHICARAGDSGGPLFTEADGKALGILSYGDEGSGACTNPDERNYYAPVSKILATASAASSEGFFLLTKPPVPTPPRAR